jgi:hypothetical protein
MATVGTASWLTWVPASLTVWPTHSRMKSPLRQSLPPSARSQNPGSATSATGSYARMSVGIDWERRPRR